MSPFAIRRFGCVVRTFEGTRAKAVTMCPCSSACSISARPVPPVAPSMSRFMDSTPRLFGWALLARTFRVSSHQFTKVLLRRRPRVLLRLRSKPTCPYGSSGPRLNVSLNGNQAAQDADGYGFCPASGAELSENGADVELHGVFRDVELRSHLLISLPKSN